MKSFRWLNTSLSFHDHRHQGNRHLVRALLKNRGSQTWGGHRQVLEPSRPFFSENASSSVIFSAGEGSEKRCGGVTGNVGGPIVWARGQNECFLNLQEKLLRCSARLRVFNNMGGWSPVVGNSLHAFPNWDSHWLRSCVELLTVAPLSYPDLLSWPVFGLLVQGLIPNS